MAKVIAPARYVEGAREVDIEDGIVVLVDGVRFEFGTSVSHPGFVILAVEGAGGEDDVWRFATSTEIDRRERANFS
jgi:hypothetical protein